MHSFVVNILFLLLVLMRPSISFGIPPLDKAIIVYLHHGLSQALVFKLLFGELVNPFSSWVCVWEGHVLHLVSHYLRLCWCLMLIHILVLSSALPWLTHILLIEPIRKLPLLHVAQPCASCKSYALSLILAHLHLLWVSIYFGGWRSYFVLVVYKYKTK